MENKVYKLIGWMTELEAGLSPHEWQSCLALLEPNAQYFPFTVEGGNSEVHGFIERDLFESLNYDEGAISNELVALCEDWRNETETGEYEVFNGEWAKIGCSCKSI